MKKKILVFSHALELGGAERALLGLLYALDKSKYQVDLFLMRHSGPLMKQIPDGVNLLPENPCYAAVLMPMKQAVKHAEVGIVFGRLLSKLAAKRYCSAHCLPKENDVACQYSHKYTLPFLPMVSKEDYDIAISFLTPHYVVKDRVYAKTKIAWIHTDYSTIASDWKTERLMWDGYDKIASISDSVSNAFIGKFPELEQKLIRIDNVLIPSQIREDADAFSVLDEMPQNGAIRLLSVGRFCNAKNFDNVPDICSRIRSKGWNAVWYLIGFGPDESLIRDRIKEAGMEESVIILGKKKNPYPYIKTCDIYIQPSRYEGNAVTVHEAQILGRPVIITNYATAVSQLHDGIDGAIVPQDNEGCARGISEILGNLPLLERLKANTERIEYHYEDQLKQLFA